MATVGQVVRARRSELGLTLQQLADAVGCTKGYLSSIETGRRGSPPSVGMLESLERALRLEGGRLVRLGEWAHTPADVRRRVLDLETRGHMARRLAETLRREGVDELHRSGELRRLVARLAPEEGGGGGEGGLRELLPLQVPLINSVSAGYPSEFTDLGYPARVADEYISVPDVFDADAFAARVVGDSMEPRYREGDVVVFSPAAATPEGSDCFVRFERDAESTFKRVYFEGDGARVRLQPLNSAYAPRVVEREEIGGMYAAVYVVRPVTPGG